MLIMLTIAAFLTAAITAVAGLGGGIVLLAIMSLLLPITAVIPVHGVVQLASNFTRTLSLLKHVKTDIIWPMITGMLIGSVVAIKIIQQIEDKSIFYLFIVIMIVYILFKPAKLPAIVIPVKAFAIVGVFVGLLAPLVGATGPMTAPFFIRDDLARQQVVATQAAIQSIAHLLKLPTFLYLGFAYGDHAVLITLMILAVIGGTLFGVKLLNAINEKRFQQFFRTVLFLVACQLLYKLADIPLSAFFTI